MREILINRTRMSQINDDKNDFLGDRTYNLSI